jgi:hypothetical protein
MLAQVKSLEGSLAGLQRRLQEAEKGREELLKVAREVREGARRVSCAGWLACLLVPEAGRRDVWPRLARAWVLQVNVSASKAKTCPSTPPEVQQKIKNLETKLHDME